ncbi:hypothetical protein [Frigoribacterium endophyticum]|uniref:hypothetical protein n=1 Tax=Frigoribacterium endophyticum TaxID=1522176 RepID=UPI0014220B5F|nr:hypothetical protein [Frigoribacterium endophyticum]NII52145.1 hypothetical protein [Frigoribacterium endophyticum]
MVGVVFSAELLKEVDQPAMALVSWAFAHGLVALVRDGALQNISAGAEGRALANDLIAVFDRTVR